MPRRGRDQNLRLVVHPRWQFWRRLPQSAPLEKAGCRYRPLDDSEADRLTLRFAERWLALSSIPESRLGDVLAATRLDVAGDESDGLILRLAFDYLGSQSFLYDWDGGAPAGEEFIDRQAEEYAAEVEWERNEFGATDWDDP